MYWTRVGEEREVHWIGRRLSLVDRFFACPATKRFQKPSWYLTTTWRELWICLSWCLWTWSLKIQSSSKCKCGSNRCSKCSHIWILEVTPSSVSLSIFIALFELSSSIRMAFESVSRVTSKKPVHQTQSSTYPMDFSLLPHYCSIHVNKSS